MKTRRVLSLKRDPLIRSEIEAIEHAKAVANKDINDHGEFNNPFCHENESLSFNAYEKVESLYQRDYLPSNKELNEETL